MGAAGSTSPRGGPEDQAAVAAFHTKLQAALEKKDLLFCFSNQPIGTIPASFWQAESLTKLSLTRAGLTEISGDISRLTNLQILELSGNQLWTLPTEISLLTKLTSVDLSYNSGFDDLKKLAPLHRLTKLNASYSAVDIMPKNLDDWTNLEVLDLSYAKMHSVPANITLLHRLKDVTFYFNTIASLPPYLVDGSSGLTNLTRLSLSHNDITHLPDQFFRGLASLQVCDMWQNKFNKLPSSISDLRSLEQLVLHSNSLTELPTSLSLLTALTWLNICSNKLDRVPACLSTLTSLVKLELRNNSIAELPTALSILTNLKEVDLRENLLVEIPEWLSSRAGVVRSSGSSISPAAASSSPSSSGVTLGAAGATGSRIINSELSSSPSSARYQSPTGRVIMTASLLTIRHSIPAEVLPNLFFGDADGACNPNWINATKISHVVAVAMEASTPFKHIRYLQLPALDCDVYDISQHFSETNSFISQACKVGGRVLVHCMRGRSRSGAIVVAYVMWSQQMCFDEALAFVKRKRDLVKPNYAFEKQLREYEQKLGLLPLSALGGPITPSSSKSPPPPEDGVAEGNL